MSEKLRLGVAVVYLLAGEDAGWINRVLMVLEAYGFSVDEAWEALKLSGYVHDLGIGGNQDAPALTAGVRRSAGSIPA